MGRGQGSKRHAASGSGRTSYPERNCQSDVWAATCVLVYSLSGRLGQAEQFGGDAYIPHLRHLVRPSVWYIMLLALPICNC